MHTQRLGLFLFAAALAGGCSAGGDDAPGDGASIAEAARTAPGEESVSARIQSGSNMTVLGVTDDDYALVWDSRSVWASPLRCGAKRVLVASDVPEPPLTLVRGRAALLWTAQPYLGNIPGPQVVSPLVVWTAKDGPHLASTASLAPQLFSIQASAAVRPDGREVLFTSNVSADGSVGDIVRASTDLARVDTLLAGVDVSLAACPPHVGYDRDALHGAPRVIVSACGPGATTATLSRWAGDRRVDLTTDMLPNSWWTSDEGGKHVLAQLSDRSPAVFTLDDAFTVVDDHRAAVGWITPDGTVFQTPTTADHTAREVLRITLDPAPRAERVTTLPAFSGFQFANHLPYGMPYANVSTVPTAPNGGFMMAFTQFNAVNGTVTDSLRVDATATDAAPIASSADPVSLPAFEIATRDSRFNLFHVFAPDAFVASTLHAGNDRGETWQVSNGQTALGVFGLTGSKIAFADNVTAGLFDGNVTATGDLVIADVAARRPPRTLARGARALFFVTASRDAIVYTSDADPAGPGLFARRIGGSL